MVQEFTGIPAAPFSGGSSYSRRLDLFVGSGSGMRFGLEPSLYPLRPSAKRVQPTPFLSSSLSPLLNNNNNTNNMNPTTNAFNIPTSSNYQIPSHQNMLNLQNQSPILSFQSFLHHPTAPLNLPSPFGVKSQGPSSSGSPMPNSLDELGISHGHGHVNVNLGGNWIGFNDQDHLRPNLDGNYDTTSQRVNNNINSSSCKLNFSSANNSSSDFHHEKGLDNVSSRPEGTVDSWICPAD